MKKILALMSLLVASSAIAQTSQFGPTSADGIRQPVPALISQDAQQESGRIDVTIAPSQITTGSQHFLNGTDWGLWIWTDEIHAHFYQTDGTRKLIRLRDSAGDPLSGTGVTTEDPITISVNWSPAGVGVLVYSDIPEDAIVASYLEGSFRTPPADLGYGASLNGANPYVGQIEIAVYDDPMPFDPCENYPAHGRVQTFSPTGQNLGNELPPQPTCVSVPDPDTEPTPVIDGVGAATFSWTRPTQNEDGSALLLADIDSYRIMWGDRSRAGRCSDAPSSPSDRSCYPEIMTVPASGTSQPMTLSIDEDVTLYFGMITVAVGNTTDSDPSNDLIHSRYSNEVARAFDVTAEIVVNPVPLPPTNVDVAFQLTCTSTDPIVTCSIEVTEPQ